MLLTIAEIVFLLCLLIFPMAGPSKKGKKKKIDVKKEKDYSEYGINKDGDLEMMKKEE